jgi:glycosyltransferase involved in cell wall biosynthesis
MKVAIVNNQAPFVWGGAEELAVALRARIVERGHEAEILRIPFRWDPPERILDHIVAARLLRIENADRVIAFKFPAYYVRHESKVLWLLHQFRQAYDLWGTPFQHLPDSPEGRAIRDAIVRADDAYLPEARRIFTNNGIVSARLKRFNGLDSEVLYPPLADPDSYHCERFGDFVFCPSRLNATKRQELLVRAMAHVRSGARLVLAGPPDVPEHEVALRALIDELQLGKRVEVRARWIPDSEKQQLFADCLACAYVPYDEDSYGFVTLEAFASGKPVVTCTDAGGVLELVDQTTGYVCEPQPEQLAAAFDRLYDDRDEARQLGKAGRERTHTLGICWDTVTQQLLT